MAQTAVQVGQENWWIWLAEGVLAILFGIAAIFWPGLTLVTLVYLFSAFVLVWGLAEILRGITSIPHRGTWWLTLLFGLFGLGVGVYLVRHPGVSFGTLVLLIGFTLIVRGVVDIVSIFVEDSTSTSKTMSVIVGLAAVLAGIVILRQPISGGVAFVWVLGLYSLISGPLVIALSLDLKKELEGGTSRR